MLALTHLLLLLLSVLSISAKPILGGRKDVHFNNHHARQENQALYLQQAQAAEANRNSGWKAMGCIKDSPSRTLSGMYVSWDNMTLPICMNTCLSRGYTYGGVQYGMECWCGNQINQGTYTSWNPPSYIKSGDTYGYLVPYSECEAIPCSGDKSTNCGNHWRNNVFAVADRAAANAAISASASASAASASAAAFSSRAAVYSSSAAAAYSTSAAAFSISSLAAYSASASAFSSSSAAAAKASLDAYSSQAAAYSSQAAAYSSQANAFSASQAVAFSSSSAAAFSSSSAAAVRASAAAYSSSSLAASAAAWSAAAASSSAASLAAYSSNAAAFSAAQSLAAYSSNAAQYSASSIAAASSAAAFSASSSAAASAARFSSAAAQYSQSVAQYSQSVAAASAAQYSQSVAAASAAQYSQSVAAYSSNAAAYSAAQSAAAYSSSAAAYSASSNAAASSAAAFSASSSAAASAARYSASASQYSQSVAAASAAQYSQSVAAASAAQYSQSVAAASASQYSQSVAAASAAQYSQSVAAASAAQYSQSVAAASASRYSQSAAAASAAQYSQSVAAASASQFSASVAAASNAAYSASSLAASAAAYSSNLNAQASASAYSASSAAAAQASEAAYSASASAAAAAAATAIPSTWSAARTSCVAEGTTGRALNGPSINSPGMSYGRCIKYCSEAGFVLAGVQYSTECYCGNILENGASLDKQSPNCNMKCGGSNDICGGPSALTLFVANAALNSLSPDFTSKPVALVDGWQKATTECVQEGTTGRALTGASFSDDAMLPSKCMAFCKDKNFKLAGVEYGRECYCGNELSNGASYDRVSTTCNMGCSGNPSIYCGGPNGIQLFSNPTIGQGQVDAAAASSSAAAAAQSSSAASLQAKLPAGWKVASTPCIEEVNGRALNADSTAGGDMTVEKCLTYCSNKGYSLAGLEYGGECYCANALQNGASLDRKSNSCTMKCNGDSSQICGGPNGISLFSGTPAVVPSASASAAPSASAGPQLATNLPAGWAASGSNNCIQEVAGRALPDYSEASNDMTISKCIDICSGRGFKLAGVEYASECFCANALANGARVDLISGQCNMACSGDSNTLCGGPNAIQLYSNPNATPAPSASTSAAPSGPTLAANLPSGWSAASTNCIEEVGGRALTGYSTAQDDMTIPKCIGICADKGFRYSGVEYGSECFCGNELSNGASLDKPSKQCNMGCAGDKTSLCGGPNAIQLYTNPNVKAATPSAAASGASAASAAAPAGPTPTPAKNLPTGWVASTTSCLQEVDGRALTGYQTSQQDMTIPKCLQICGDQGFHYAGVQYGSECFCGAALSNGASLDKSSGQCVMSCTGDKSTLCGGPNAIQLYENAGLMPSATTLNGFTHKGCMQEVVGRALNATSLYAGDMTLEKCIGFCNDKGYSMAGLEYGEECFCGNTLANQASIQSVSYECKMPCAGNNKQICGGPDAINLYSK